MSLRRLPAARRISGSAAPAFCVTGEQAAGWSCWPPYSSVPLPSSWSRVGHEGNPRDLLAGRADAMIAYSTNEPFVLVQLGAAYRTFAPAASGIDFYGDNLCASEAEVKAHPDRVAAFRAASVKGWAYALEHKEALVDLILRSYSAKKSREALLFEAEHTEMLVGRDPMRIGEQDPARWQAIAATYRQLGLLADDT